MAFCDKCGAYIPIGESACPACGYDPEEEARRAEEEAKRAAEAEARRQAEEEARRRAAEAEAARKKAAEEAEARRRARESQSWAAQERAREEARRRAEQARQSHSSGAAQSQYTSARTGQSSAYQSQYTSARTGSAQQWAPPWQETRNHGQTGTGAQTQSAYTAREQQYDHMRAQAADSAANQNLSILSYLGPLFLIPLLRRGNDDFVRYHANQGLSLFLVNVAASVLGTFSGAIAAAGTIFTIYCMVKGIGNVLKGKKEPLPFIGKWKLIK